MYPGEILDPELTFDHYFRIGCTNFSVKMIPVQIGQIIPHVAPHYYKLNTKLPDFSIENPVPPGFIIELYHKVIDFISTNLNRPVNVIETAIRSTLTNPYIVNLIYEDANELVQLVDSPNPDLPLLTFLRVHPILKVMRSFINPNSQMVNAIITDVSENLHFF